MTTPESIAMTGRSELFGHPIAMPALAPHPAAETLVRIVVTLLVVTALSAAFSVL